MMFAELVLILLITLVLAALIAFPLGRPGPWGGFWWLFLVLFLGTWALTAWIEPVGPSAWGVAWVPILVGALLVGLLVASVPPRPTTTSERLAGEEIVTTVGAFFWLFVMALIAVIGLSFVIV